MIIGLGGTGSRIVGTISRLAAHAGPTESFQCLAIDESGKQAPDVPEINAVVIDLGGGTTDISFWASPVESVCPESLTQVLQNPDCLYSMEPHQFEDFVAGVYSTLGYTVHRTKQSHDGGVDLIIEKAMDGMQHRYIVQCKHTVKKRRKIGVNIARDLVGTLTHFGATAAILVTNALFSRETHAFLECHTHRLFGVDPPGLLGLISKAASA